MFLKVSNNGKKRNIFLPRLLSGKKKRDAPSSMTLLILVIYCTFFVDIFASSLLLFSYFLHFLYRFTNLLCVCFLYMLVLYLWYFLSSLLLTCITFLLLFDLIYLPNRHFDHIDNFLLV